AISKKRSLMLMGIRGGSTANSSIPSMGRLGGTRSPVCSAGEQLCHLQYVEHAEGHGDKLFAAACNLGLEGIVSKKLNAPYRSGPSKIWIKIKNPKAPAATRAIDGTF